MPVLQLSHDAFARLSEVSHARLDGSELTLFRDSPPRAVWLPKPAAPVVAAPESIRLEPIDRAMLAGEHGKAAAIAMRLVLNMAKLQGADALIDVTRVHIDGCIYTGPASLRFAELLVEWQAKVRVPTTLNAISVDRRRWRELGVEQEFGLAASALADAYLAMGAEPSFTCAPYLLDSVPAFGEQIGWAESNAVVYANSVLGARTMKYPDYLDVCIALTGRAPRAGCHLDEGRRATLALDVALPQRADDAFWPLLGYICGSICGPDIPLIRGLERSAAGADELKAFGAAFATMTGVPMFHIAGITPEADGQAPERVRSITLADLREAWQTLNTAPGTAIGLVSLGNPHFSLTECAALASLVQGRSRAADVAIIVTLGRAVHIAAAEAGHIEAAEAFGVVFVTDTCWCMLGEPVVPPGVSTIMTNSGKYAHYAPGLVGRDIRFGSLAACIEAACSGHAVERLPDWLDAGTPVPAVNKD